MNLFKKDNHEQAFLDRLGELNSFKALIGKQRCPSCGQNGLKLQKYVRKSKQWDAEVKCDNCNFYGIVTSQGFDFKQINSKGEARE